MVSTCRQQAQRTAGQRRWHFDQCSRLPGARSTPTGPSRRRIASAARRFLPVQPSRPQRHHEQRRRVAGGPKLGRHAIAGVRAGGGPLQVGPVLTGPYGRSFLGQGARCLGAEGAATTSTAGPRSRPVRSNKLDHEDIPTARRSSVLFVFGKTIEPQNSIPPADRRTRRTLPRRCCRHGRI